jgi:hypothetical protein
MGREEDIQKTLGDRSSAENATIGAVTAPKLKLGESNFAISGAIVLEMARPPGFEPGTLSLEGIESIIPRRLCFGR